MKSESCELFEVEDFSYTFVVNMEAWSCNCNRWDLSGIPCTHALTVMSYLRVDAEDYVTFNNTAAAYRLAYDMRIFPVPSFRFWPDDLTMDMCSPPVIEKKPGRPIVKRVRHPSEGKKSHVAINKQRRPPKCRYCGERGHNMRNCPLKVLKITYTCLQFMCTCANMF